MGKQDANEWEASMWIMKTDDKKCFSEHFVTEKKQ
jgi:hypothetical protein